MTQKKVTITDIAKASGVSKTTISRYLNGRFDLMSPETRRRIESVIDVSGYQPSTIARSLKNKRSLLLGIVVSDQSSPFSTAVLLGVGDALRNTEYVPVFVNCDDDPAKERYQISFLLSRGVDGLIVNTTSYENPFLVNLEARGVPVVLCVGGLMLLYGAGRGKKGFGKVTGVVAAVYNGVTGFFSDILSYVRLMALMLSGAVLAQVFNMLGATTGNIVLFVIIALVGNALNLALNLLGCYVHDMRLQFLEFFGRFYKDGGKAFRPLRMQANHVEIIKEEHVQ